MPSRRSLSRPALLPALLALLALLAGQRELEEPLDAAAPNREGWRAATAAELESALPARAPVEKERIETEMRTATGIIDSRGRLVAAVVLITAGYAADGKYSHYLLVQAPLLLDGRLPLAPGSYALGWTRVEDTLEVTVFDAASGAARGTVTARPYAAARRVESVRIWPPAEGSVIQIGRFAIPYRI
jgi:hypothetical protein